MEGSKLDVLYVAVTVVVLLTIMAILIFDPFAGPVDVGPRIPTMPPPEPH
jgi:hypothetical protein